MLCFQFQLAPLYHGALGAAGNLTLGVVIAVRVGEVGWRRFTVSKPFLKASLVSGFRA